MTMPKTPPTTFPAGVLKKLLSHSIPFISFLATQNLSGWLPCSAQRMIRVQTYFTSVRIRYAKTLMFY